MSGRYLGLDTSNYRTSAAFFEDADHWRNEGRLLSVPQGERGLRQSDAVFQHVKALHGQIAKLGAIGPLRAVAASVTPRTQPGSYMPCFLVGETVGRSVASLSGLPFYAVSHQQGHVAAAAFSAGVLSWLRQPFYVWHVSGGTTELLLAEPDGAAGAAPDHRRRQSGSGRGPAGGPDGGAAGRRLPRWGAGGAVGRRVRPSAAARPAQVPGWVFFPFRRGKSGAAPPAERGVGRAAGALCHGHAGKRPGPGHRTGALAAAAAAFVRRRG